jgi:hypothetical protein
MLVVMEHRDVETRTQHVLDRETVGGGDVFEVDTAEGRGDVCDGIERGCASAGPIGSGN